MKTPWPDFYKLFAESFKRVPGRLIGSLDSPPIFLKPHEGAILFRFADSARIGIVEIGRMVGGSLFLLAWARRPNIPIWSIELKPRHFIALPFHRFKMLDNLFLLRGNSQADPFPQVGAFDLIFVDGDHTAEGVGRDLAQWWPRLSPGGRMVLHDCEGGGDVHKAVADFIGKANCDVILHPESWITRGAASATGSLCVLEKGITK